MRERPILFSGPMVREVLAGRKTQTRRVTRPQLRADGRWPAGRDPVPDCPYGVCGDRLWVREAWRTDVEHDELAPRDIPSHSSILRVADSPEVRTGQWGWGRYRHARFMPRRFSRIDLEVLSVRVERLKSISDDDILAEGVTQESAAELANMPVEAIASLRDAWFVGWSAINGRESWDANPWVWVIEFRRVRP